MDERTGILASYLAEAELAREIDHHPATLRRWRKAGVGPKFTTLGGDVIYSVADVRDGLGRGGVAAVLRSTPQKRSKYRAGDP